MMESFARWCDARHEYARRWKEKTRGRVLGYFCTYFPEEILYAADILPVRILGSREPRDPAEPGLSGTHCAFCRECLGQGLDGSYDYLDGIGIAQACLHMREAFSSWRLHLPVDFDYDLPMPNHVQSRHAEDYLHGELVRFRDAVERWTRKPITDDDLRRGIAIVDANRRLLREVYETRKAAEPPIRGLEAMSMVLASQVVDKRDHSAELERLLPGIRERKPGRPVGERLMVIGAEDDDTGFLDMVESLGATVVVDEHCTGSRYFWNETGDADGNPLKAIARRYLERPACPTKDWPERKRIPHLLRLAQEYGVRGAVLFQATFCDPHELDAPAIQTALEEELDVPTLVLEIDPATPIGRLEMRCREFLESLRARAESRS